MTVYIENELEIEDLFDFDYIQVADNVCRGVLDYLKCPLDCEIDIIITDNENIRAINNETRGIDKATDVLSFPNLFFEEPGIYCDDEQQLIDCINPENKLVVLGEIILSYDRIKSQAQEYGHSEKREYAFLIAHSMLHLSGYDHMEPEEAEKMESLQREILDGIGITRD